MNCDCDCDSYSFLFFFFFLKDGRTPLYIVCRDGHVDIAKMLLQSKANVDLQAEVSGRNDICDDLCDSFHHCFVLSDE